MDAQLRTEYRDYSWKYFSLHADQRLKAFNFFVIFATFLIGAFGALVVRAGLQLVHVFLPIALIFITFVFWKLEERTRMLVKNGEMALKFLDESVLSSVGAGYETLALFAVDDVETRTRKRYPVWSGYFSYSRCFRWVFIVAGLLGVIGTIVCVATIYGTPSPISAAGPGMASCPWRS